MKIVLAILPVFVLLWAAPQKTFNGSLVQKAEPSAPDWLLVPDGMDLASADRSASSDLSSGRLRLSMTGDDTAVFRDLASQYQRQGFVISEVTAAQSQPGRPHRMLSAWEPATGRHATMLGLKAATGGTLLITYRVTAETALPGLPTP